MICETSVKHNLTYGRCGKCMSCRVDRTREWTARILFESYLSPSYTFCTLTYAPEHLPQYGSLDPDHTKAFLKALRQRLDRKDGRRLRFYLVGEYGDPVKFTGRAHYHVILFNTSIADTQEIQDSWPYGFAQVLDGHPNRIRYCAGYIQKKLISKGVDKYPDGRRVEFARMSRMPGLGSGFIKQMALDVKRFADRPEISGLGITRIYGRKYPIDRYGRALLISELVRLGVANHDAKRLLNRAIGPEDLGTVPPRLRAEAKVSTQKRYHEKRERLAKIHGYDR